MRGSLPSTRIFTGYTQKIDATLIIIIYKPPSSRMTMASLPVFLPPSIYAGDFNCQHTSWGYQNNSGSGNCLVLLANLNDLSLLYNPKEKRVEVNDHSTAPPFPHSSTKTRWPGCIQVGMDAPQSQVHKSGKIQHVHAQMGTIAQCEL